MLPHRAIGDNGGEVFFQSETTWQKEYTERGTLGDWRAHVAAPCVGNSLLRFQVSAAFAGPLLKLCNMDGAGFHAFGPTTCGKTTGSECAASVWGDFNAYMRTWKATVNGLEGAACLFNDGLLVLTKWATATRWNRRFTHWATANRGLRRVPHSRHDGPIPAAAPFERGLSQENTDLPDLLTASPEDIAERLRDAALDLAATRKAAAILRKGGPNVYDKARRALTQDSRDWWNAQAEEEEHPATAEGLAEFIRET